MTPKREEGSPDLMSAIRAKRAAAWPSFSSEEVRDARFKRMAASLGFAVGAARPRLEALGITVRDYSNPGGFDWVQSRPYYSWDFVRTSSHSSYTMSTTATIRFAGAVNATDTEQYEATWRSEAWQNTNPNFHVARGSTDIGPEHLGYGVFENLVLALLRRAAPAFPELLDDAGWPGFPDLPSLPQEVDHLVEVQVFHKEMVEPWSGPPAGCGAEKIAALETRLGWRLPLAYKQYLAFMGDDRKGVFRGCDWFIDAAHVNTIDAELAYMEVDYTPPGDTLTFMSHQGYMFGWFDLPARSDDPPVYFYSESSRENKIEHHVRFTDLLLAELRHMSYFLRRAGTKQTGER